MTILIWLGTIGILLCAFMPFARRSNFLTDLPSHFVLQAAIGAMILMAGGWWLRINQGALYLCLLLSYGVCLYHLWPYLKRTKPKPEPADLKILHSNVLYKNKTPLKISTIIDIEDPDLVVICESHSGLLPLYKDFEKVYPHQEIVTRDGKGSGLAVLSKKPFSNFQQETIIEDWSPRFSFTLDINGKALRCVALHATNPLYRLTCPTATQPLTSYLKARDQELQTLGQAYNEEKPSHFLAIGDFNATPWCPAIKKLFRQTDLKDARRGFGIFGTFHTKLPFGFLRLPIDLILRSPAVDVLSFRLGAHIGSDHLPVITEIKLK